MIAQLLSDLPYGSRDADSLMAQLQRYHVVILDSEKEDLFRLGISSLVQSVCKRRGRTNKFDDKQQDFWSSNNLRNAVTVIDTHGKRVKKRPNEMTFAEMERYVKERMSKKPGVSKSVETMAELLSDLKSLSTSPNEIVAECWSRVRASEAA